MFLTEFCVVGSCQPSVVLSCCRLPGKAQIMAMDLPQFPPHDLRPTDLDLRPPDDGPNPDANGDVERSLSHFPYHMGHRAIGYISAHLLSNVINDL